MRKEKLTAEEASEHIRSRLVGVPAGYRVPRHPNFDAAWAEHHRLVYYWANKLCGSFNTTADQLVGTIVLYFNYVLWKYKPDQNTKFVTYFSIRIWDNVRKWHVQKDSDAMSVKIKDDLAKSRGNKVVDKKVASVELMRENGDEINARQDEVEESWTDDVLDAIGGQDALWKTVKKLTNKRELEVLSMRCSGIPLKTIGESIGVSKERVRQIEHMVLARLRKYLVTADLERFVGGSVAAISARKNPPRASKNANVHRSPAEVA